MHKRFWHKYLLGLVGASMLLQAPTCTDVATVVTGVSSAVTAGGVLYLVRRVID